MTAATPMTLKDARAVLGLGPAAGAAQLRSAFRQAVKKAHPDRPGGGPDKFRRVVEAYKFLQDAEAARTAPAEPPAGAPSSHAATPIRRRPGANTLHITPQIALQGGAVEHDLTDGRRVRIRLPAGLRTGDAVRAGEARLQVRVTGGPTLLVRGHDLWITVDVPSTTLKQGGRVTLDTPLGPRSVWITRKAAERGLVMLDGQGLPARGRHGQGDLFLRLTVAAKVDETPARGLLRRFAAAWAA